MKKREFLGVDCWKPLVPPWLLSAAPGFAAATLAAWCLSRSERV